MNILWTHIKFFGIVAVLLRICKKIIRFILNHIESRSTLENFIQISNYKMVISYKLKAKYTIV